MFFLHIPILQLPKEIYAAVTAHPTESPGGKAKAKGRGKSGQSATKKAGPHRASR